MTEENVTVSCRVILTKPNINDSGYYLKFK